jgi:hypothetical protein
MKKNVERVCEWEPSRDDVNLINFTGCGYESDLWEADMENFKFCPYCGRKIKAKSEVKNG